MHGTSIGLERWASHDPGFHLLFRPDVSCGFRVFFRVRWTAWLTALCFGAFHTTWIYMSILRGFGQRDRPLDAPTTSAPGVFSVALGLAGMDWSWSDLESLGADRSSFP